MVMTSERVTYFTYNGNALYLDFYNVVEVGLEFELSMDGFCLG